MGNDEILFLHLRYISTAPLNNKKVLCLHFILLRGNLDFLSKVSNKTKNSLNVTETNLYSRIESNLIKWI
jgi:hypothetical protein